MSEMLQFSEADKEKVGLIGARLQQQQQPQHPQQPTVLTATHTHTHIHPERQQTDNSSKLNSMRVCVCVHGMQSTLVDQFMDFLAQETEDSR